MATGRRVLGIKDPQIFVEVDHVIIKHVELTIWHGDNERYWKITEDGAELLAVCWFQLEGSLEMKHLVPCTRYKLEFNIVMKQDARGWKSSHPLYISLQLGKGRDYIWKKADMTRIKGSATLPLGSSLEFTTPKYYDGPLHFGLYEFWNSDWKTGLVIKEVVISVVW